MCTGKGQERRERTEEREGERREGVSGRREEREKGKGVWKGGMEGFVWKWREE